MLYTDEVAVVIVIIEHLACYFSVFLCIVSPVFPNDLNFNACFVFLFKRLIYLEGRVIEQKGETESLYSLVYPPNGLNDQD